MLSQPQMQPHQKAAFAALNVPDQHHDQLHQAGITPEQIQAVQPAAAAVGINIGQLIQLLLTASPQILAFIEQILALVKKPAPAAQAAPQAQQPPAKTPPAP